MRMDKLTTQFQQALADAQSLAVGRDHQFIEPVHLMLALLNQQGGSIRPLLEKAGLAPFFDAVVTSDDVGRRKPDPAPFLHACRTLGVAPGEAAVVGDSANDAEAARAAGCRVLLVTYGYSERRDVRTLDSDGVIDTLGEAANRLLA